MSAKLIRLVQYHLHLQIDMRQNELDGVAQPNGDGAHPGRYWKGQVDVSRTPSPRLPAKRMKMTLQDITHDSTAINGTRYDEPSDIANAPQAPYQNGYAEDSAITMKPLAALESSASIAADHPSAFERQSHGVAVQDHRKVRRRKMRTGCVPCL